MSKVITPVFRASYVHIWEPTKTQSGKDCYSVTAIFEPDADLSGVLALVKRVAEEKWPGKKSGIKLPFRKGAPEEFDLEKNPAYEGKLITTLRSYGRAVGVLNPDKTPMKDQGQLYSGCFCIASITAYAYDFQGNKGVSLGLSNLMKIRDGEPLVSVARAEEDFGKVNPADFGVDNSTLLNDLGPDFDL